MNQGVVFLSSAGEAIASHLPTGTLVTELCSQLRE